MKFYFALAAGGLLATAVSSFQPSTYTATARRQLTLEPLQVASGYAIDYTETAQRDVYSVQDWARNYGVQTADGFDLSSYDGQDWFAYTNNYIPAGSPVLYIPSQLVLSSNNIQAEFGGNLLAAENVLAQYEGSIKRAPLFRLMVKILSEYEAGDQSPYFPWLNSLPRQFFNGVAMTDACFECLPPYAALLSMQERNNFSRFLNAAKSGFLPLSPETINNDSLVRWAYNVALTRHQEVWVPSRMKKIAPLADMINHSANPNVAITYDEEGNCMVTAVQDIQAGSQLTMSLGNPTNPTPIFAKYGFLPEDCTNIFCKAVHLLDQIETLGYDFKDLLFDANTGDIAPKVWDLFLYSLLQNDPNGEAFLAACLTDDEGTKQQFHGQYFPYTLQSLKAHVDSILYDVDMLTMKANSYDVRTHPRVPVIVAHNDLVKRTFINVKNQLDAMG